ncbi:MAG TPA: glycosyltransferase family 4 protein, partial [Ignavibacteriales bacterium]|nr:glycosyltransferase family 4 protein [Ignavibacteriales bacterium]
YVPNILKEDIVFSAGRLWDEAKNITALADAADKISAPVYIAGDTSGPVGNTLEFGNVNFLGVLSEKDIASWMGRSAIYALPARYEPFGLSVLEAALSKCALVLGGIETLRELWDGAAIFVQAGDSEHLAYEINSLLNDPNKRALLVDKSYKRALQLPSETTAVKYLKTYNELYSYKSANVIL